MIKIPLNNPLSHCNQRRLVWCLQKWRLTLITLGIFLTIKYMSYQYQPHALIKQPEKHILLHNGTLPFEDPPTPITQSTPSCIMPRLTPGGEDIYALDKWERKPKPICIRTNSTKFAIDFESNLLRLHLESEAYFWSTSKCFYKHIWRIQDKPDFDYGEGSKQIEVIQDITKIPPEMEYIHLLCYKENSSNLTLTYEDYLSHVPIKPALEELLQDRPANLSPDKFPSILIFGQDSSSHMNFRRYMPKAHDYLVDTMKAVEFHGFNSLGDGTLWSVFPLLSGLNLTELNALCRKAPNRNCDSCPWLWNDLEMLGYRTSYAEDAIDTGIFNEGPKSGFSKQPVHYDFRAMTNKLIKVRAPQKVLRCYGTRLTMDVLLENSVKVAYTFARKNKPFFHFAWAVELTHDRNYMSQYGEAPMLRALKQLHQNQLLNNTVLILLSDHGIRYGKMRQTTRQGFLEERLPLLYIYLPESLRAKYPQAYSNLKQNTDKLITTYDIYEMMKDLTQLENLKEERLLERANVNGIQERRNISLFLPISSHRTCGMIGFSSVYCACMSRTNILANTSIAQGIAELVLASINEKLFNFSQCARLEIAKITSLYTLNPQLSVSMENARFGTKNISTVAGKTYEVGFDTKPGRGMYYASVIRNKIGSQLEITGINRVSAYDKDADCMDIKELKPFCYCK